MPDPYPVKPDTRFLHRILGAGGGDLKKCFQCATCSVVCELADGKKPFPRKEMIWAQWGLRDRLLADPDVWLCYQCNDCSTHCPRGARPGDVMATIRRESVLEHAMPQFLGRWMNRPASFLLLLGVPVVLLGLLVAAPLENGLGTPTEGAIAYSCWNELPHPALIAFFTFFSLLALLAVVAGAVRFWRAMKAADARRGIATTANGLAASLKSVLKEVVLHNKFTLCTTEGSRSLSHLSVFYGFLALLVVAIWVVSLILFGPLIRSDFIYPFSFWNPWRMLANLGGVAVAGGSAWMVWERLRDRKNPLASTFFDWAFIGVLLAVVLTGLLAEGLHYARLEPHRIVAYFAHLALVFTLLMYLPYGKFAHLVYRTTALVYAEYSGRSRPAPAAGAGRKPESERQQSQAENKDE